MLMCAGCWSAAGLGSFEDPAEQYVVQEYADGRNVRQYLAYWLRKRQASGVLAFLPGMCAFARHGCMCKRHCVSPCKSLQGVVACLQDCPPARPSTVVPERDIVNLILRPLLDALSYLHHQGIAHRVRNKRHIPSTRSPYRGVEHTCLVASLLADMVQPVAPRRRPLKLCAFLFARQDVKPENAVLTHGGCVKLIDFGLAVDVHEMKYACMVSNAGTVLHASFANRGSSLWAACRDVPVRPFMQLNNPPR